jgi:hypothetical protein
MIAAQRTRWPEIDVLARAPIFVVEAILDWHRVFDGPPGKI